MKILLAGATGAIGRPLVRRLLEAGHEVVGLTRREDRASGLNATGAHGVVCDVTDRDRLLGLAAELRPDVVVDQTTDLPQRWNTRRPDEFYAAMLPLRLTGSPNLLEAAQSVGARSVFQSIGFLYAPGPGGLRTESDAPYLEGAPPPWNLALPVITTLERRTVDLGGTVLRFGMFYGPGTHFAPGNQMHSDMGRGRMGIVGRGEGVWSFIHVDDAAAATVAAVERDVPGIFNVVDDEPIAMREWLPAYAGAVGARKPMRVPAWVVRRFFGELTAHWGTTMPGASNARARDELGWAPQLPSVREGFATALDRDPDPDRPPARAAAA